MLFVDCCFSFVVSRSWLVVRGVLFAVCCLRCFVCCLLALCVCCLFVVCCSVVVAWCCSLCVV